MNTLNVPRICRRSITPTPSPSPPVHPRDILISQYMSRQRTKSAPIGDNIDIFKTIQNINRKCSNYTNYTNYRNYANYEREQKLEEYKTPKTHKKGVKHNIYNENENDKTRESVSLSVDDVEIIDHLERFRSLNGVIYGQLLKFEGSTVDKIKGNKMKPKFVAYIPQKQILFYSKTRFSNESTTVISVQGIESNNNNIEITRQIPHKYRNKWLKITGVTRIVLFASLSCEFTSIWYKVISNSLKINLPLIQNKILLSDKLYLDGWLGKLQGTHSDNIQFRKRPCSKYVIFIPSLKIIYFCGGYRNKVKSKMLHIRKITRKNRYISNYIPLKYHNTWFKIVGDNRIIVFVTQSVRERDVWFKTIFDTLHPKKTETDNVTS